MTDFTTMTLTEIVNYRDECWDILYYLSEENDGSDESERAVLGAREALEEVAMFIDRTKLLLSL